MTLEPFLTIYFLYTLLSAVLVGVIVWILTRRYDKRRYQKILKETDDQLHFTLEGEKLLYKSLLDNVSDGIVLMDPDYTIIQVNKSFLNMFEYAEGELLGNPLFQYILTANSEDIDSQEALIKIDEDSYEAVRVRKNGDPIIVNISTFTIKLPTHDGHRPFICSQYSDVTEKVKKEKKITELAYFDSLTSLPNRYLLEAKASELHLKGDDRQFSFVFMDLNGFKHINDTLGHEYGDALLIAFSKRVKGNIKKNDFLARIGGDEFVLLLPNTPRDRAYKVVERINGLLENPFMIKGQRIFIGVAAGITGYPDDSESIDELQRFADIAMYTAKQQKIPYLYYDEKMKNQYQEKMTLEQNLASALKAKDEILLHYLPVIDFSDQRVVSVEALCRWNHPELGVIPPSKFIPIAEDSQLIYELGAYVLKRAFKQAYNWHNEGYDFGVTVNLSAKEVLLAGTLTLIKKLVKQYPGVEKVIGLEITESITMLNAQRGKDAIKELKAIGLTIILDDFGSGYSSLSFLRDLEADRLKIDKHLIDDIEYSNATTLILKGLLHLAQMMDLQVIAEGISSIEQMELVQDIGFAYGQGFLFSKPVKAADIDIMLEEVSQCNHFLRSEDHHVSNIRRNEA